MWTLPNILTLCRVPLMFLIVWFSTQQWIGSASLAFFIFIFAAISDWMDGAIARKRGVTSNFGKFMDAVTDKILVIGLMVSFIDRFDLPLFYVLVTICREFLVSGMRMIIAAKGVVVAADKGGKLKTILQMLSIGLLLASTMLKVDFAFIISTDTSDLSAWIYTSGLVGFAIGTFLAIWSGYRYFRINWLAFTS